MMSLRLIQTLCCKVCDQIVDPERQSETAVGVALFGSTGLAVCPCCHQEVPDQTKRYLKRAVRFLENSR